MTDEPLAWIDERTLRVPKAAVGPAVLHRMAPDVYARVQSIFAQAQNENIMFVVGDGPYEVTERDLHGLCEALDPTGAVWSSRPGGRRAEGGRSSGDYPAPGEWPCQQSPSAKAPPYLLAFLYVLLRDGASAPGDVEQLAINAGRSPEGTTFTNPHLERYARALVTFLLEDSDA